MAAPEDRTARAQLATATPGLPPKHRRFVVSLPDPAQDALEILAAARQAVRVATTQTLTADPAFRHIVRSAGSHGLTIAELSALTGLYQADVFILLDPFEAGAA